VNGPQVVWLVVGVTSIVGLLAVVAGLFKQVKRLGKAVVDFGNEVRPTLEQLRAEADRAQQRTAHLADKGQAIRDDRSRR
jgi:uncharacterized protein YoxC